ncbi:MAG: 50S ribosomal protein L24 [Muribaculaceae bacterium]|jgi:large subunit ribosomal protein L24|nr:50S ribosomal protein L24 [Muribaculaceae bacterium]
MATLKIKKGDTVFVIAGNSKDNKPHRVLEILPEQGKAIVEGVNIVSKSTKPNAKAPQGGIIKKEAPIDLSNLAVADPKSGKPTRVGFRFDENGKKVRYSKKSGEEIK